MTLQQLIHSRKKLLSNSDSPALDALILLCRTLKTNKEQLYARLSTPAEPETIDRYDALIARRSDGEPIAYITGEKEFFGLNFHIDARVLIPRPETETLVSWVLASHADASPLRLHDCCSGSGAIAIALQYERPNWKVSASDISRESGEVFHLNWKKIIGNNSVPWQERDMLGTGIFETDSETDNEAFHIITANPPYLTSAETADRLEDGWQEPSLALDGGDEGVNLVRRLIAQAGNHLHPDGWLYLEAADSQVDQIFAIFTEEGFADLEYKKDLAGMRRVSRGRRT